VSGRSSKARGRSKLGLIRGNRYSVISEEAIVSAAYGALPDYARVVLVALSVGRTNYNNGTLSLTFPDAKERGVSHPWKLYAGLKLLELTGLIVCTRQGHIADGGKVCSLFGVTWEPIIISDKYDAGIGGSLIASHAWAQWSRPADWAAQERAIASANHGRSKVKTKIPVSTTLGTDRSTTLGTEIGPLDQPRGVRRGADLDQHMVDTSKIWGSGGTPRARARRRRSQSAKVS
jgi:hypothetical protein